MNENKISNSQQQELFEAYKIAIEARNFHYDNFSKWMTFYYVAVAAIFITYYSEKIETNFKLILPVIGLIVSILWYLSCKGYYFWIKNWAYQIKRFEDKFPDELKVYTVFSSVVKEKNNNIYLPLQSSNISTSKATLLFSFIACMAWGYMFTEMLINFITNYTCSWYFILIISIIFTYGLILLLGVFLKSNITEHQLIKT